MAKVQKTGGQYRQMLLAQQGQRIAEPEEPVTPPEPEEPENPTDPNGGGGLFDDLWGIAM